MEVICHIVGITSLTKNKFVEDIKKLGYHIIDLDDLSNNILRNSTMTQMFSQYQGFKDTKNDKFKEIETFAYSIGFKHAAVGALVRSSYHADEQAKEVVAQ